MNCPEDIADVLLQIIQIGALRARAAGWSGDAKEAAVQADHIHNLPMLLRSYSLPDLMHYWNGFRTPHLSEQFGGLYAQLEPLVQREARNAEAQPNYQE